MVTLKIENSSVACWRIKLLFRHRYRHWLLMCLMLFQLDAFAMPAEQIALENWQYRWGDSTFVNGKAAWLDTQQLTDSSWQEIAFPANPPNREGQETIWYRTVLPAAKLRDPVVFISSIDLIAEVYLDQHKIYQFGEFDARGKGQYQGWPWHMINLPDDFSERVLSFRVYSNYTDIGLWGEVVLLERSDALLNIIDNSHKDLIISAFFFFIAILAFAFACMRGENREFIYLGLFSLASAGNLLGESQALQLLVFAPLAKTYLAAISYFAIPIFIGLLLQYWLTGKNSVVMLRLAQLHSFYLCVAILLSLLGIVHLAFFYPIFDALFVVSLLVMGWVCVSDFKAMHAEQRFIIIAFAIYALFFLIDMAVAHGGLPWMKFPLALGALLFALVLVSISLRQYRQTQMALRDLNRLLEQRVQQRTASLEGYMTLEKQRANHLALLNQCDLQLGGLINRLQQSQSLQHATQLICQQLQQVFSPIEIQVKKTDEALNDTTLLQTDSRYQIAFEDAKLGQQSFIYFELVAISPPDKAFEDIIKQFSLLAVERLGVTLSSLKLRQDLQTLSFEDGLTGLKNRRFFDEALQRQLQLAQRHKQAISLLICDIDHFKQFNDQHGHDAGDMALRSVASVMLEHFRETDIPCRYGGEEFVVLMPLADIAAALERTEKLLRRIAEKSILYQGRDLGQLTVSMGVASWQGQGTPPRLVQQADKALYRAKIAGRNQLAFFDDKTALISRYPPLQQD